jgi:hopanoid C-3 methylase
MGAAGPAPHVPGEGSHQTPRDWTCSASGSARTRTSAPCYRLFDIRHAVVPTALPLERFYAELVRTQAVINRKHLGLRTSLRAARILGRNLLHGQTNYARMLWKCDQVHNPRHQLADHSSPVRHELPVPPPADAGDRRQLYVHTRGGSRDAVANPSGE